MLCLRLHPDFMGVKFTSGPEMAGITCQVSPPVFVVWGFEALALAR